MRRQHNRVDWSRHDRLQKWVGLTCVVAMLVAIAVLYVMSGDGKVDTSPTSTAYRGAHD